MGSGKRGNKNVRAARVSERWFALQKPPLPRGRGSEKQPLVVLRPSSYRSAARVAGSRISTRVRPATPLAASHMTPSGPTIMCRTTPPPDGITQLWNFSVFVSKRTSVFLSVPDSLYQMMSPIARIPYGSDFFPLGEGHSLVAPVLGSSRPR